MNTFTKYLIAIVCLLLFQLNPVFAKTLNYDTLLWENSTDRFFPDCEIDSYIYLNDSTLFLKNNKGTFVFKKNKTLEIKNLKNTKLTLTHKGDIYAISKDKVGKIEKIKDNQIVFTPVYFNIGSQIEDIASYKENLLFHTKNKLYEIKNQDVELIDSCRTKYSIFKSHNGLYIYNHDGKLLIYNQEGLNLAPLKKIIIDKEIVRVTTTIYKRWTLIFFLVAVVGAILILRFTKVMRKDKSEMISDFIEQKQELLTKINKLQKKNKFNEELLAKLLPTQTADEIRNQGKARSHRFDMVTILFADIQGFTKIAEQLNPENLIDELDKIFLYFDSLADKYNIEKIKTIGDAYMCAGGIPIKNSTNPVEVVLAALDMQDRIKMLHQENIGGQAKIWNIRIGVHTGPVIAGVIGKKKFSYDIWGDSVNVASRMESSGDVGRVNISSETYELAKEFFDFEYRGKMPVKYKGEIEMYFVNGILPELSESNRGRTPNKLFMDKLTLLRFEDIKEIMFELYEQNLPKSLTYHNLDFCSNLIKRAGLYALGEHATDEETLIAKTAALFYISGLMQTYENFHVKSGEIAEEKLPIYDYSKNQIKVIRKLISFGVKPLKPKTLTERIFSDALLDYLGSFYYTEIIEQQYGEIVALEKNASKTSFLKKQAELLKAHSFSTPTAITLRDVQKAEQIEIMESFRSKK